MGQDNKAIKVLISTKEDLNLKNFKQIGAQFNWEVVKLLMQHKGSGIKDETFNTYLGTLEYIDDAGKEQTINTDNCWNLSGENLEYNVFYVEIVNKEDKYKEFSDKFKQTEFVKKRFLQNSDGTVFIVPTLCDNNYNRANVEYVNELISWLKIGSEDAESGNNEDWYLLLHDKDLLSQGRPNSKVTSEDESRTLFCHALLNLVEKGRVFVFQHDGAKDYYYNHIVKKLDNLTPNEIVELLNGVAKNINLSGQLIKIMEENEMKYVMKESVETFDFSKQFLEL